MSANLNFQDLDAAINRAFKQTMFLLGREMTKTITDQGLVDTGRFRSSQQLTFNQDGSAMFAWNVDYAIYLYLGHTLPDGTFVPGCPWTIIAMQNFGIAETMTILLQQELG